ncbi:hypothetical protein KCP78_01990 [Salmonella enterica subsp. enterica]|nr:hypothetical protein KCP78_01990 [Salmonella enterica subsp. enterica]
MLKRDKTPPAIRPEAAGRVGLSLHSMPTSSRRNFSGGQQQQRGDRPRAMYGPHCHVIR